MRGRVGQEGRKARKEECGTWKRKEGETKRRRRRMRKMYGKAKTEIEGEVREGREES